MHLLRGIFILGLLNACLGSEISWTNPNPALWEVLALFLPIVGWIVLLSVLLADLVGPPSLPYELRKLKELQERNEQQG